MRAKAFCVIVAICAVCDCILWVSKKGGQHALKDDVSYHQASFATLPSRPFQLDKYDTIYLFHTRKAGGSTLRKWLGKVSQKHNLTFAAAEGHVVRDDIFNNHTLYITSLRDPVDRAISSYWFEGRWPQNLPLHNRTDDNAVDFVEWATNWGKASPRRFVWHCSSECYCKWFGTNREVTAFNITAAIERLKKFDLIVQTERMDEKGYLESLGKLLNASNLPIIPQNRGHRRGYNSTYRLLPTDLEYLGTKNKLDKELLRLAFGNST